MTQDERDVAAALVVALDAGLLSMTEAVRVIDREIERQPAPSQWLINASLARTFQDLVHAVRPVASGHPLLEEVWPLLEAMERSVSNGADPVKVARLIERFYPYRNWPAELNQALYDVYEEATCAHEHDGVPEPQAVRQALIVLFREARVRSGQRSILERVLA